MPGAPFLARFLREKACPERSRRVGIFFQAERRRPGPESQMKNEGMNIRHAKARGEWAELRFMTRATALGFRVTKPWGDNSPYDLATDYRRPLPPRPGQMHHLQTRQLLRLRTLRQPRPLPPRPDRLHRRLRHPHRNLVHPPPQSHPQPARHRPLPPPQKRQVFQIPGSLAPPETLTG